MQISDGHITAVAQGYPFPRVESRQARRGRLEGQRLHMQSFECRLRLCPRHALGDRLRQDLAEVYRASRRQRVSFRAGALPASRDGSSEAAGLSTL
jgi:hypothetical protein